MVPFSSPTAGMQKGKSGNVSSILHVGILASSPALSVEVERGTKDEETKPCLFSARRLEGGKIYTAITLFCSLFPESVEGKTMVVKPLLLLRQAYLLGIRPLQSDILSKTGRVQ